MNPLIRATWASIFFGFPVETGDALNHHRSVKIAWLSRSSTPVFPLFSLALCLALVVSACAGEDSFPDSPAGGVRVPFGRGARWREETPYPDFPDGIGLEVPIPTRERRSSNPVMERFTGGGAHQWRGYGRWRSGRASRGEAGEEGPAEEGGEEAPAEEGGEEGPAEEGPAEEGGEEARRKRAEKRKLQRAEKKAPRKRRREARRKKAEKKARRKRAEKPLRRVVRKPRVKPCSGNSARGGRT